MAKKEWVSFNQNMNDAILEIEELEKQGYVVVDSYGNDFDMGNVYEYSLAEDRQEVLKRHHEHVRLCEENSRLREAILKC